MVHSGGASGGHYYAFVKRFDSGQWIKVNGILIDMALYDFYFILFMFSYWFILY